jgi:hypothetical protein
MVRDGRQCSGEGYWRGVPTVLAPPKHLIDKEELFISFSPERLAVLIALASSRMNFIDDLSLRIPAIKYRVVFT